MFTALLEAHPFDRERGGGVRQIADANTILSRLKVSSCNFVRQQLLRRPGLRSGRGPGRLLLDRDAAEEVSLILATVESLAFAGKPVPMAVRRRQWFSVLRVLFARGLGPRETAAAAQDVAGAAFATDMAQG